MNLNYRGFFSGSFRRLIRHSLIWCPPWMEKYTLTPLILTQPVVALALGIMSSQACIADDWPYAKIDCDTKGLMVSIEELSTDDRMSIPKLPGIQDLYALTEIKKVSQPSVDDDVVVKKKDFWFKCQLGEAGYKFRISPWKFSSRVNGMCGGYSPSIELSVWRNGVKLLKDIVFSGYCNPPDSEVTIGRITLMEKGQSAEVNASNVDGSQIKSVSFSMLPKMTRSDFAKR